MIHALLDTNVVLDALLDRTPWNIQANAIWQAQLDKQFVAYVTATTLTDIFYISRRYGGLEKAWRLVHAVLNQLPVISVGSRELQLAIRLAGSDFEDNLQVACAINGQLDLIVTRNLTGFSGNNIPILTPQQMLLRLSGRD
ncbi:PIN domain-containing protein [Candidatus Poribacteria bacterium]|nr:PIN domain-containing protein [Candidatus Poribacteria bacterium]MYG07734.1 PIN domain-containing protein [Candidatus Poribacteria bacterium]MYK23592.1 PIN domain-containing protein [Candidatus Poribacteria bacterium]